MKSIRTKLVGLLMGLALVLTTRADSIINNFTSPFDYLATGIIGDTNWDGVYLNAGDILGGTGANGQTLEADSTFISGFLTVQETGGAWAGSQDDGFFLYKVVQGDFDASVEIYYPFDSSAYHLPGLLARAYNPNGSGTPYSATDTNALENWVYIARFQEFSINEHGRYVTNGVDHDGFFNTTGDNADTNSTRYVRITRVGNVFSFYDKTNQADAWNLCSTLDRPDLDGVPMQVGIEDACGTGNSPLTFFTDFELSGTNVTFPAMPAPPSNLVTTATNINGTLTFSWTKGNPGDSSLVVMSRGRIQHNPVNGLVYNANGAYGDNSSLLGGAGQYVVYSGANSSVTVSNLSANIFTYNVSVFEYTNNGVETVYNTAAPATNSFRGPGVINNVTLSDNSTNIPVNGATSFKVFGDFSTGEQGVDETANATWSSSDPGVAAVNAAGAVSGVAAGSATISAALGTYTNSVDVAVHGPFAFSDSFANTHDFLADGLVNSMYDGLFLNYGDVPGGAAGADGPGSTVAMNSQITDTNGLYMSSVQSTWQGSADDGPFLFKIVPGANQGVSGDFQALVHINSMSVGNGVFAGIMARLFNPANAGPGPDGQENHVNYWKVQNGTTSVRTTEANANTTVLGAGPSAADGWLLIQRQNSTNFYFYEKGAAGDLWTLTTNIVVVAATNDVPMEVGPVGQSTVGLNGVATFDTFAVDAPGMTSATPQPPAANNLVMTLNQNDLSMTLDWVAADSSGNPVPSIAVMRAGGPVTAVPPVGASVTADSVFGNGTDLGGGNYVVFADNSPASTNNTVTVTGLSQGQTYYAVVYTYAGSGNSTVYNPATTASANLVDAAITNIYAFVQNGVPEGGIGKVTIYGVNTEGQLITINTSGAVVTSGDTNTIQAYQGVLTGIATGTAGVHVVLGSFAQDINVTVRPPSFTDDFTTHHDYLVNGVANSSWDGLYNPNPSTNPIPGSLYAAPANSGASVADTSTITNITITATNISNGTTNYTYATNIANVMTITSAGDGWENAASGGFFLFKYVPGDFQMACHIYSFDSAAYNQPGILARGYAVVGGVPGYPLGYSVVNAGGTNDAGEYWVDLTRFDENFGGGAAFGTYARRNVDSVVSQNTQGDYLDGSFWLLIVRSGDGSQFDFYKRVNVTDPWRQLPNKTRYSISQLAGQPMQVGLMAGPWTGGSGNQRTVQYDHFMLDAGPPPLQATQSGGNVDLTWPAVSVGTILQQTLSLNPANWQAVTGSFTTNAGMISISVPMTNSATFFRLAQP